MVEYLIRHTTNEDVDWLNERINYIIGKLKSKYVPKFREDIHSLAFSAIANDILRFFYYSEYLKLKNISFSFLYYVNLFRLSSYKNDYQLMDKIFVDSFTHTGDPAKRSQKGDKLLDHHLFNYIQTSLVLRDREAIDFYAMLQPRNSIPGRYYFEHDQDFEQLLILLCNNEDEQSLMYLRSITSKDYIQSLTNLPFQTAHLVPYLEFLFLPLIDVYLAILEKKEAKFNESLYKALSQHKTFYESEDEYKESRRGLPEGWVSLPLTAACVLAHQKGLKPEIESDYIPEWLIKAEFDGLELIIE
ncbi:immunity 49 family protein [Cytophagaceae bacterium DM2B3-1]|uniref:Immunity 49 family protein n=1 Tax=Xanthocytophaga flava TaxID=3048013 RepID=A0ABT7CU19_9BACT|nr:immunity 49 family protein [Xanthocytophaga flavus]MDJ1497237.1 immunity 49 family protein [Xanthocytophaga flavus]